MSATNVTPDSETPATAMASASFLQSNLYNATVNPTHTPVKTISWLKSLPRWVNWKLTQTSTGLDKLAFNPTTNKVAESDDPSTWATYAEVCAAKAQGRFDSYGIALGKEVGLVVVDFDKVRATKNDPWPEWVLNEIEALDSYTEVSASGRGFHVLLWGSIPSNHNKQKCQTEIWDSVKMFVLTGDVFEGRNEIRTPSSDSLLAFHARVKENRIGPSQGSSPLIVTDGSQRFANIMADNWGEYFSDRSAAVHSALCTLARKHN
jgi:hypothetical protein